ncbi:MAG: tetratricopeptide repeat protein, partial [Oscillospiraceae bacterium]|nr:tetratricopeptide repeat protein [Oscillospiraceae bacterium]
MEQQTIPSLTKMDDMSVTRFLDCVREENGANQRFCFILGSGASYTSGIRTGVELMKQWRQELNDRGTDYIRECARAANYDWDSCKRIFEESVENLKNEDYFTLYDIRFVGCPTAGYAALEKEMEGLDPNVGYYYLASILANTDNRLVITTNFDSLTEDALFYYSGHHPLVLGHEKLASYVASVDRKPVVAKIHRDLLMDPMNHMEQMQRLQKEWKDPLSAALSRYIPIVIGYAGGDQTLMSLLEQLQLKGIFWCTVEKAGEAGFPEKARQIVRKNNGHWVKIKGFDELMYRMATIMQKMPNPDTMHRAMDKRYEAFKSRHEDLTKEYNPSLIKQSAPETADEDTEMIQAVLQEEISRSPDLEKYNSLLAQALRAMRRGDFDEALKLCGDAIALNRKLAKGYDYRSAIYHRTKNYEAALVDATQAIACDPTNARYYHSRAVTLHQMKRYEESLKDKNKAVEFDSANARYYNSRSVTLHEMKRYEEALNDCNKAVELAPDDADHYESRSATLCEMERYEEALADINKAIGFDPVNALYYNSRSIVLHAMERYEEALADINKAIGFDPVNALYYNSRSIVLLAMERYEEALDDCNKAVELAPNDAEYYGSRSVVLHAMERYE